MKYFDIKDLLASFKWMLKNEVSTFEKEFSLYTGIKYVIATGFGRTALYLGLKAIDVQDKEVIVPSFLCTVVRAAVVVAGAIPIFVDVDIESFSYNLEELKSKISKNTKAIVLIHYFGRVARNMDDVINIAEQNNLVLVEDCAHSLGAGYKGRKVGSFGDFSIFSLTKGMINCGGGFFATNSEELYNKAKDILEECKMGLRKRIVDFPLVIQIGVQQYIDKVLVLKRYGHIRRWLAVNMLKWLLFLRLNVLKFMRLPSQVAQFFKRNKGQKNININKIEFDNTRRIDPDKYIKSQGVYMEPIMASLGRTQLRKLNQLIKRRKEICNVFDKLRSYHFLNSEDSSVEDVHTYIVLWLPGYDLLELIARSNNNGILLKTTWPHDQNICQDIWEEQDSENLRRIKDEIVTWEVNPMLSEKEINGFIESLNS